MKPEITDTERLNWVLANLNQKDFEDKACGICSREDIDAAIKQEDKLCPICDQLAEETILHDWLKKQPNWEAKVELGNLLMIPQTELSPEQLARLSELRDVLWYNTKHQEQNAQGDQPKV